MSRRKIGWKFAAAVIIFLIIAGAGLYSGLKYYHHQKELQLIAEAEAAIAQTIEDEHFFENISVEGVSIAGMTRKEAEEALADKLRELRDPVDITLQYEEKTYSYTTADFTYENDLKTVLDDAYDLVRCEDAEDRLAAYRTLLDEPVDFSLTVTLDDSCVEEMVADVAADLNEEAVDGKVEFHPLEDETFTYEGGKDGLEVDEETTCASFKALLATEEKTGSVGVEATVVKPEKDIEALKEQTVLLSTFSTTATSVENSRYNMGKALSIINGTVLEPEESFSFNDVVGNSSIAADGWRSAPTLSGGKTVDNYGGGVCQAATTLYGALMRANLWVSERSCHAWPSTYVPKGQDATISYGYLDLKFENNSGYTIYIEAWMEDPTLTINIYGYHPEEWDTIEVVTEVTATHVPGETIFRESSSLPAGTEQVDIESRIGYSTEGYKEFYKDGVVVDTAPIFSSYYAPVTGVVLIGTG